MAYPLALKKSMIGVLSSSGRIFGGGLLAVTALLLALLYSKSNNGSAKLLQAYIIFRHGNRTPLATFPTDRYQEDFWDEGFGSLTDVGKEHSFLLGSAIRKRYIVEMKLIDQNYDKDKFFIVSTDVDRTLETAALVLAGVFPVGSSKPYPIEPIPTRYIPKPSDYILNIKGDNCPKLAGFIEEIENSPEFLKAKVKYKSLFDELSDHTGYTVDFSTIGKVYKALVIEKGAGLQLPKWASDELLKKLKEAYEFRVDIIYRHDDKVYRRLAGGNFLYNITTSMKKAISGDEAPSLFLYSAHDTTVEKVFDSLRILDFQPVPYNAALAFELYFKDNDYYIRIMYRDSADGFRSLKLPDKEYDVLFEDFIGIHKDIISSTVGQECNEA